MVSKGWCVTRDALTPHEITVACVLASLMYMSIINMYALALVDVSTAIATAPTLVMYIAVSGAHARTRAHRTCERSSSA